MTEKGKSPFYPGQPVPVDLFVGRKTQIDRILERGVSQVVKGKPVAMFLQGEYGIGKSSIANYAQFLAERQHGLYPIYATIGGAQTIEDVGAAILEGTVRAGAFDKTRSEAVFDWLGKYIGEQNLFGVTLHVEALRKDAPQITAGMLPFLRQAIERLSDTGVQGIFLVLDEINGLAGKPEFAHFIKGLVDTNAMTRSPVPLLLMLCGVEECYQAMIKAHSPVDRIFDVIEIATMSKAEMESFFRKAFESVNMTITDPALTTLTHYSAGFPKIVHLVGDAAYWKDVDGVIDSGDALRALVDAADDVGKKYVDQQVYNSLRSADYKAILKKVGQQLGESETVDRFNKAKLSATLTTAETKKLNNFLQKMKQLRVIRSGDVRGEYVFNMRMVGLHIWLNSSVN